MWISFPQSKATTPNHEELDELISELFAQTDNPTVSDQHFFNLLLTSPAAYTRIVHKFLSLIPAFDPQEVPELLDGSISMKPVDDVLKAIKEANGVTMKATPGAAPQKAPMPDKGGWLQGLSDMIERLFAPVPGYAFAAASIAVLLLVIPFHWRCHQSGYLTTDSNYRRLLESKPTL